MEKMSVKLNFIIKHVEPTRCVEWKSWALLSDWLSINSDSICNDIHSSAYCTCSDDRLFTSVV